MLIAQFVQLVRIAADTTIPAEDVQKYLLATSDFRKGMQDNINLYVVWDRLNNASFRQKLDPIEKNIFGRLYSTSENKEVLKKYTELWVDLKMKLKQ